MYHIKHFKHFALLTVAAALWGCSAGITQMTPADVNLEKMTNKEAIVLFKLSPRNPKDSYSENFLWFRNRGVDKDGLYQRFMSFDDSNISNVYTKQRYAIFKTEVTSPKEAKVIEALFEYNPSTEEVHFVTGGSCGGELLTLQILEPGIYYLGDISYGESVSQIGEVKFEFNIDTNLNSLLPFLKEHYPQIPPDEIKIAPIKYYWDRSSCGANVIYI